MGHFLLVVSRQTDRNHNVNFGTCLEIKLQFEIDWCNACDGNGNRLNNAYVPPTNKPWKYELYWICSEKHAIENKSVRWYIRVLTLTVRLYDIPPLIVRQLWLFLPRIRHAFRIDEQNSHYILYNWGFDLVASGQFAFRELALRCLLNIRCSVSYSSCLLHERV